MVVSLRRLYQQLRNYFSAVGMPITCRSSARMSNTSCRLAKLPVRRSDIAKTECRARPSTFRRWSSHEVLYSGFITLSNSYSTVTPRSLPLRTFHPITPEVVVQEDCPRHIDFEVTAPAYIHPARPRHQLPASLDIT